MRKRTRIIKIRLTDEELDSLTEKVQRTNFSREGFCRAVLNGATVKEAPPADVPVLIREVRRVGYNIEQILRLANAKNLLDAPRLRKALDENRAVEKLIAETYTTETD